MLHLRSSTTIILVHRATFFYHDWRGSRHSAAANVRQHAIRTRRNAHCALTALSRGGTPEVSVSKLMYSHVLECSLVPG
eukprot:5380349-Pleurochrysis_carterae.AAC.5